MQVANLHRHPHAPLIRSRFVARGGGQGGELGASGSNVGRRTECVRHAAVRAAARANRRRADRHRRADAVEAGRQQRASVRRSRRQVCLCVLTVARLRCSEPHSAAAIDAGGWRRAYLVDRIRQECSARLTRDGLPLLPSP